MKKLVAVKLLVSVACAAFADDGACSADIKIYRVLADISGPVHVAGAAAGVGKEEAPVLTLSYLMGNPSTLTVGGLELSLQGSEARWGDVPEPNRPDIVLLADMPGIEFKEEATVTLSDAQETANGAPGDKTEGFRFYCSHGHGRHVRVIARLERSLKAERQDRGPKLYPAPEALWQSVDVSPEPDAWTGLIFSVSTISGKSAGSFLVLLKTHGAGFTDNEPQVCVPAYAVEMKFVKMPASTAELFRGKYERIGDIKATPENAELFRIGREEPRPSDDQDEHPTLLNWLNDQEQTELLSAPRITLYPKTGAEPPKAKECWFKVVLRAPASQKSDAAYDDIMSTLAEFTPRLSSFLEEHRDVKPGVITDMTSEYDYNKEHDRIERDTYGIAAAVALKPMPGTDAVQTSIYWNVKNRHESKRGLKFWKKPAPLTFTEFPAETTLLVRDRECFGLLRPYEPADMWLLCTVCVTKLHPEAAR